MPVVLEDYRGLSVSIGCLSQQPGSGLRGSFGVGRHYCPQVGGTWRMRTCGGLRASGKVERRHRAACGSTSFLLFEIDGRELYSSLPVLGEPGYHHSGEEI